MSTTGKQEQQRVTTEIAEHFGCDPDNVAKWPAPMRLDAEARMIAERRAFGTGWRVERVDP